MEIISIIAGTGPEKAVLKINFVKCQTTGDIYSKELVQKWYVFGNCDDSEVGTKTFMWNPMSSSKRH